MARVGNGQQAATLADGASLAQGPPQHLLPPRRWVFGVRLRAVRPGPGPQVSVPVFDCYREAREVMQGVGDARLSLAGHGHLREAHVDLRRALQRTYGVGQRRVGRAKVRSGGPFACVEAGVGEGNAGLLREDLEQEQFGLWRLVGCSHNEVAMVGSEPAQWQRPAPRLPRDRNGSAVAPERAELRLDPGAYRLSRARLRRYPPTAVDEVDAFHAAVAKRRQRCGGEVEDLALVHGLGHQHREHQQALQIRQLFAETGVVRPGPTGESCHRSRGREARNSSGSR